MKFSYATIAAVFVTVVSSQTVTSLEAQLPSCGLTCLESSAASVGCGTTDAVCLCGSHKAALAAVATPCIVTNCSTADALSTQKITAQICALVAGGSSSSTTSSISSASSAITGASTTLASSISSTITSASSAANSTAPKTSASPSSKSSSAVQVSAGGGSKLQVVGAVAGAALLAAFAL